MEISRMERIKLRIKRLSNRHITLRFFYCMISEYSKRDEILGISPGITFYFIMGFIPFLIFSVNVILFSTAADIDSVVNILHVYFPTRMADTLEDDINRIVAQRSNLWLWISLFAAAYSFEKGLAILVRASDVKAYKKRKRPLTMRNIVSCRDVLIHMKSILYAIGLVASIMISLGFMVFGNMFVEYVQKGFDLSNIILEIWSIIMYGIPLLVLIVNMTIFYMSSPRSYTPRVLHALLTAFIVTILWIMATIAYRWVFMIIPSIGESYGPLFGLFTMFGWFYYIVNIIIVGLCLIKTLRDFQHKLDSVNNLCHAEIEIRTDEDINRN